MTPELFMAKWRPLSDIRTQLGREQAFEAMKADLVLLLEASEQRVEEEAAIVDSVWKALGVTTYEQAGGKYIHELVEEVMAERDALAAQVAALRAELAWALEFVTEPEWFPNEGDRQYWQERKNAIREGTP